MSIESFNKVKRGDVFYVEPNSTYGHEMRSGRPAVIVSNDINNRHSPVVEVVYLTTRPKPDLPTHVMVRATGTPSTALCEQVSSVDRSRLGSFCGSCTVKEMQSIDTALLISLGLDLTGGGIPRERTWSCLRRSRRLLTTVS